MPTIIVKTIDEVIEQIKLEKNCNILSIDGWMNAGKTFLLDKIKDLNFYTISIDSFLDKGKGLYLEAINITELESVVREKLESGNKIAIEGVCIKQILTTIKQESDISIYIKEMGVLGWVKEDYVDESKTPEDIFIEDDKLFEIDVLTGGKRNISVEEKKHEGLFYDVVRYHYEYQPHISSDIIYGRTAAEN
jgi:hypothetical protein